MVCRHQGFLEGRVGVNGEVGRDEGKLAAGLNRFLKETGGTAARVIVAKTGGVGRVGRLIHRGVKSEQMNGGDWIFNKDVRSYSTLTPPAREVRSRKMRINLDGLL